MRGRTALSFAAWAAWMLLAVPAHGDDEELEAVWSISPMLEYDYIESPEDDDGVTGFFDQYDFVPNKSSAFPVQIGIADAALDLFAESQTPVVQLRLASPTSNLGISGDEADHPFLNQRGLGLGRFERFDADLHYWRMRTEDLRVFPNTAVGGLVFTDLTQPGDRFYRERSGFDTEVRSRLDALLGNRSPDFGRFGAPELSLRGGYEARKREQQLRFLLDPANQWTGLTLPHDQKVGEIGSGLLLAPWRAATLSFDFDYERFREQESPLTRGQLGGGAPALQTIGFVPDTDRYTGSLMLRSRMWDRLVVEAGAQASYLEQVQEPTPLQAAAGLRDNSLLYAAANLSADLQILDRLSANAYGRFEQRDNDIDRSTALFNPTNGTQVDEFVDSWKRWLAGVEGVYRFDAAKLVAVGARFEAIDRELDFVQPGLGLLRIVPANALVADRSRSYTFYARTRLRLLRRVQFSGELGYRIAPDTGYVTELDDNVYGRMRAAYTLPLEKPVVLAVFARGGSGDNDDLSFVSGTGDVPAGPVVGQSFDQASWLWGVTASSTLTEKVGVFGSFFMSRESQDYDLILSSLQRYVQPVAPVAFSNDGREEYRDDRYNLLLGTHVQLDEQSDASLAYSFTRADTRYLGAGSADLALIAQYRGIEGNIHGIDLEAGRWIREGLRVRAGYGFRYLGDDTPLPVSTGSVVAPFDLTTMRHTVTLGVTLTNDLLSD